jgi:hypothetical protein
MPPPVAPYPDIEQLLVRWLAASEAIAATAGGPVRVVTLLPLKLPSLVIRVAKITSNPADLRVDRPAVDIDAIGFKRDLVKAVSQAAEMEILAQLPGTSTRDGYVTRAAVIAGSHWLPDENQDLHHYSGSYEIRCHA